MEARAGNQTSQNQEARSQRSEEQNQVTDEKSARPSHNRNTSRNTLEVLTTQGDGGNEQ